MDAPLPDAGELVSMYLDQIPYEPYPVQEEALLAWFSDAEGILVTAPTGTGKTLIAEAAMFEALHTRKVAYYTTPLIALTEQKFQELQEAAVRWGFSADDIGLITGNRKVNADAPIKVVVAEILLNRLLHPEQFDFSTVSSVVMDEFHSFNDPERGVVWELSLALLPKSVRLMLLSATVGNAVDFLMWLRREHGRKVQLIQGQERKVPLEFIWADELLADHLEEMHGGAGDNKRTPALVFCFNREECWSVAEQLKGKKLLSDGQQKELSGRLDQWDWKIGAGPKLKQILLRGVGVHHAGMLPKYRRRVEKLFQEKLLSVCVCTETLAAGINLPARSVVMTSLMKGPPGKKTLVDPSSAHQIFGRAGRPQFDTQGYVYALAHEDDVKIARWKTQYDQIPEDTKDPNLIRMKKKLKKKMPTRRSNEQYWNEEQFRKLIDAKPANLVSKGQLPWRLLAYLIQLSPDVDRLRMFARKRLLPPKQMEKTEERLLGELVTLYRGGFIDLDPPPEGIERALRDWPLPDEEEESAPVEEEEFGAGLVEVGNGNGGKREQQTEERGEQESPASTGMGMFGSLLQEALAKADSTTVPSSPRPSLPSSRRSLPTDEKPEIILPKSAFPTERLAELLVFRGCHPLYGAFLLDHLGIADRAERLQILESVLEVPGSMMSLVRVPPPEDLPPGPLARQRIDPELIARGLVTQADLDPSSVDEETDNFGRPIRRWAVPLGDKLRLLFDSEYSPGRAGPVSQPVSPAGTDALEKPSYGRVGSGVHDLRTRAVWIAGDLISSGLDYQQFVTSRDLTKQEGIVFRHFLRMILLCDEFAQLCPAGTTRDEWTAEMSFIRETLSGLCHQVDPESTDKALESMRGADVTQI